MRRGEAIRTEALSGEESQAQWKLSEKAYRRPHGRIQSRFLANTRAECRQLNL